jgi:type IV pilus assembly protein PilC
MLISISNWIIGTKEGAAQGESGTVPGWIFLLGSPLLFWLLLKLIKQSKMGRYGLDTLKLNIPIMGPIVGKTSVARFTRTLGTLISAGVPILEAINITRETADNEVFARALGNVHDAIREGDSFANPLRAARVVDTLVVNMVDVGEETGDLDKMLMKVADNYDEEVETMVAGLVSLLEPVMVAMLGGIVGFIVLALFLPLVQLINSVSSGGV